MQRAAASKPTVWRWQARSLDAGMRGLTGTASRHGSMSKGAPDTDPRARQRGRSRPASRPWIGRFRGNRAEDRLEIEPTAGIAPLTARRPRHAGPDHRGGRHDRPQGRPRLQRGGAERPGPGRPRPGRRAGLLGPAGMAGTGHLVRFRRAFHRGRALPVVHLEAGQGRVGAGAVQAIRRPRHAAGAGRPVLVRAGRQPAGERAGRLRRLYRHDGARCAGRSVLSADDAGNDRRDPDRRPVVGAHRRGARRAFGRGLGRHRHHPRGRPALRLLQGAGGDALPRRFLLRAARTLDAVAAVLHRVERRSGAVPGDPVAAAGRAGLAAAARRAVHRRGDGQRSARRHRQARGDDHRLRQPAGRAGDAA